MISLLVTDYKRVALRRRKSSFSSSRRTNKHSHSLFLLLFFLIGPSRNQSEFCKAPFLNLIASHLIGLRLPTINLEKADTPLGRTHVCRHLLFFLCVCVFYFGRVCVTSICSWHIAQIHLRACLNTQYNL